MPAGKNICKCPLPPGGEAVCNEEQLAICRVVDGVPYTECVDLGNTADLRSMANALKYAVSAITKNSLDVTHSLTMKDLQMLSDGRHASLDSGEVTFKLPDALKKMLSNPMSVTGVMLM